MKNIQWMTGLSLVALLLGGCTEDKIATTPTQKPPAKPAVAIQSPVPSPPAKAVPSGLILSKNPTTLPIAKGRVDPFGSVTVSPVRQQAPSETTKPQATKQPTKQQTTRTNPPSNSTPKTAPPTNPQTSKPKTTVPPTAPPRSDSNKKVQTPPLAPVPTTEIASAVEVTGVIHVGEKLSAIVKAPNDSTSRYVSAGEYLSQGQVLVKRIELSGKEEPVVILEQNGVEVVKSVSRSLSPVASIR